MKKISKRFLTLAITCVMAMAMAVPAFIVILYKADPCFMKALHLIRF